MPNPLDPEIFSFEALATRLGVPEEYIENYLQTGKLREFKIDHLNFKSPYKERRRVLRLLPILNEYARTDIDKLFKCNRFKSKREQEYWDDIKDLDILFYSWIQYYGWTIDTIRIVIPLVEVERFEKEYNYPKQSANFQNSHHIDSPGQFDANKFINDCLSRKMNRYDIAVELVEKHGSRKEKFFGLIARMLAGFSATDEVNDATWRQRGSRFYKKAKNRPAKKS